MVAKWSPTALDACVPHAKSFLEVQTWTTKKTIFVCLSFTIWFGNSWKNRRKAKFVAEAKGRLAFYFVTFSIVTGAPDPSRTIPFVIVSGHVSETHAFGKKLSIWPNVCWFLLQKTAPRSLDLAYFFFWVFSPTMEIFVSFAFMQIFVLLLAHDLAASNILVYWF